MRTLMISLALAAGALAACRSPVVPQRTSSAYGAPPTATAPSQRPATSALTAPVEMAPALSAQSRGTSPRTAPPPASRPVAAPARSTPTLARHASTPPPGGRPLSRPAAGMLFPRELPIATVLAQACQQGRPALLYFRTDRCGWCDRLKRETLTRPHVEERLRSGFVTVEYDAGRSPGRELARRYVMPGYPVLVVTDASGREIGRVVGYREAQALLGELACY